MVHEGITDWLYTISVMELAIKNSIEDSSGLSSAYSLYRTLIGMSMDMLNGV